MATLDWSKCPAVESVPGKSVGAWVFRDSRTLVPLPHALSNHTVVEGIDRGWDRLANGELIGGAAEAAGFDGS